MRTREQKNEYSRKYYQANLLKIRKQHLEYQSRSRERLNLWASNYRKTSPGFYKHVEKMAKRRGIDFKITKEEFLVWLENQKKECFYCQRQFSYNRDLGTSPSIDRGDNKLGYDLQNIVLCCELCNRVKNKYFSVDEMRELGKTIKKIINKRNI